MPKLIPIATGTRFGDLTVLGRATNPHGNGSAYWECACACGAVCVQPGRALRNGSLISCGCSKLRPDGLRGREAKRDRKLMRDYGITAADFDLMADAQGGRCAICHGHPTPNPRGGATLHVDHCHTTGRVRGLLCGRCNRGIGLLQDDPDILTRAARYVSNLSTEAE